MPETLRCFIAFELPEDVVSALRRVQERLREHRLQVKWVQPERIHLTLKFLGDIASTQIEPIAETMREAARGCAPMSLQAKGLGVFPSVRRPRVIWAGLAGQIALLAALQQKLDAGLGAIGFSEENRPFQGHLTLGRFKASIHASAIRQALEEYREFETDGFAVHQLILFRSELRPSGAVYSTLSHVPL